MAVLFVFIRLVGWLAPAADRNRWREEWLAEIAQVACTRGTATAFRVALGALPDAIALRRVTAERTRHRADRRNPSMTVSSTDLKLAIRMLVRYPGLTAVGALGMTVGITIAAAALTITSQLMNPALPFPDGDRIVGVGAWDVRTNNQEQRVLHEFALWRAELRTIEDLGAFRLVSRNLIEPGTQPETVAVAEISASAFRVTRVAPALGRPLLPEDEQPTAPDVAVIGDDVWRRRFGGDRAILGREVQLGSRPHTIVGVMPPGFRFPIAHSYWVPLRIAPSYEPLTGPAVTVFGRLAAGATLQAAQAEVGALGERLSTASPVTHEHLRARAMPYTHLFTDMDDPDGPLVMRVVETMVILMLAVVCVNVAILVYARTATRQGEIAVRSALGAGRARIVGQLFLEALALSGLAAVAAIGVLSAAFRYLDAALRQLALGMPFWLTFTLSPEVVLYVVALALLSAAIIGIVPAVKATGRRVQSGLQGLSAGSGSRMQMGRFWTVLIVAQVGIAVAVLPATVYHAWNTLRFRAGASGFASHEFLSAELTMERAADAIGRKDAEARFRERYGHRVAEIERMVEAEPSIAGVTWSLTQPGGELAGIIEVEGAAVPSEPINYNIVEGAKQGHLVRFNRVAADFFDAFDVPILMGRGFEPRDSAGGGAGRVGARPDPTIDAGLGGDGVVVDRTFADRFFGGQNPLGRRIRYVGRSREAGTGNMVLGRWYEIVGVVSDFPPPAAGGQRPDPRIYHVVRPGDIYPAQLAVRVRGPEPAAFAPTLRQIAAVADPALQLRNVSTVDEAMRREQSLMRLIGVTLVAVIASVVTLSAAGIYALMAFTVARRRKEIGIRAALGADQARILAGVFSRALAQLGAGAAIGMGGSILLEGVLEGEMFQGHGAVILPLVAVFMTVVGLLAAWGPARRGLRVHPTEALREE